MDPEFRELLDRQAIGQVLTAYARAIDRLDLEALKALYHPEARDNHAAFEGSAQDFATHAIDFLRDAFTATMHHVTHSHIELFGDSAVSESYFYAYHRLEGDEAKVAQFFGRSYVDRCLADGTLENGHEFICGGRYIDLFTRREGAWRIADREITVEWNSVRPATMSEPGTFLAGNVAPAGRGPEDVVYRFIARACAHNA